jgi:hypothetical protein
MFNNESTKGNEMNDTYRFQARWGADLSVAQTAKLLRTELRKAFPRVRFSVRSQRYAGGASINVSLNDASADTSAVREVADAFQSCDFDGNTDSTMVRPRTNGVRYGAHYVFVRNDADVYAAD